MTAASSAPPKEASWLTSEFLLMRQHMASSSAMSTFSSDLHKSTPTFSGPGAMDQVLKSRELSSASVRRRKFQERQQQNALEREKMRERKRMMMIYDPVEEELDDFGASSRDEMDSGTRQCERRSSIETPSECSVSTPDDTFLNRAAFGQCSAYGANVKPTEMLEGGDDRVPTAPNYSFVTIPPPSPAPVLQASLATLSDFRYDRYSVFLDSPISELLSSDSETEETLSPVEVATPVAFSLPKSRPSLISIACTSQHHKRITSPLPSPLSQSTSQQPERPAKRRSISSSHSGFPAAEATLLEVPDLPASACEVIANASANASQESLVLPLPSRSSRSKGDRKSSLPRLSIALSHARMSSIKTLIKTPTTLTGSRSSSRSSVNISRPSTACQPAADQILEGDDPMASTIANNLAHLQRSTTTTSTSSTASQVNMTALPTPPADDSPPDPLTAIPHMGPRKKSSFSVLRRRSESIGQALKGFGKSSTRAEAPAPLPLASAPTSTTPRKQYPLDLSAFPTPPLPSPRTGTSSAASFTSASIKSSDGAVGLGLKSVDLDGIAKT
ncbi:hypothetical protein HRR83_008768 [Exophiala dermatitidis]|uniref:Uncharacterized protein n=1 Tax=Exophiala dermatitidis TaxID=5970 RepID=A0AAN6EKZ2_EXODE|nr:hypothetical protein HRR73_009055 [Exophiala dermatitidis]KAJ4508296.1 hypothetical protein HRR74_007695 [Exophiala dermatitidis]KAJ4533489.1 hypothetical protein HRR77_008649 [Exophiala dermatitidis]KAJ4540212.1 hypothetical protein HRR76_003625 [Exophiala dermatitidis]KAJ4559129.1 hypothetical protein HRR79_008551 [Exophiala dermatitidis]